MEFAKQMRHAIRDLKSGKGGVAAKELLRQAQAGLSGFWVRRNRWMQLSNDKQKGVK